MLAGDGRVGGQRHEGGGRADRVVRPVLGERVQHDARLEAVGQHEGAHAVQAGPELADHAGDVEQGRQREVDGRLGQAEPGALPLGVVHDVAVGVGGSLGGAAGARGVADERGVAGLRVASGRGRVSRAGRPREVVGVGGVRQPLEGQDAGVLAALEVQLAPGEHDPHRRVRRRLAQIRLPGPVGADERGHLAVPQDVAHLPRLVHRVDGHHHRARLPGPQHREDEVRGVLQQDRDPLPALQAPRGEVPGDGVGQLVDLAVGEAAVEVGQEGPVGSLGGGPAQGVHQGGVRVERRLLGVGQQVQPGLGGVAGAGHRAVPSSHCRWSRFMPRSQRSGSTARAW